MHSCRVPLSFAVLVRVMYWLAAASNRPSITDPMMKYMESTVRMVGGITEARWGVSGWSQLLQDPILQGQPD